MIATLDTAFGRQARCRLDDARAPGPDGARAALETFYYAFNNRSQDVLRQVWLDHPLSQLNNPLGGVLRGLDRISELYGRVFTGPARAWVELYDIAEYRLGDAVVFAGRERGEFTTDGVTLPMAIRTSRVFGFTTDEGWRQLHHHGSIDEPTALAAYQDAVRGRPMREA